MSSLSVKDICQKWIDKRLGHEPFWESWPKCPTPEDSLTPIMVMDYIKELELPADDDRSYAKGFTQGYSEGWDDGEDKTMSDWQPMETAPKDGSYVLIFDGEDVVMARWLKSKINERWSDDWYDDKDYNADAIFWMPLPEPPKLENGEKTLTELKELRAALVVATARSAFADFAFKTARTPTCSDTHHAFNAAALKVANAVSDEYALKKAYKAKLKNIKWRIK